LGFNVGQCRAVEVDRQPARGEVQGVGERASGYVYGEAFGEGSAVDAQLRGTGPAGPGNEAERNVLRVLGGVHEREGPVRAAPAVPFRTVGFFHVEAHPPLQLVGRTNTVTLLLPGLLGVALPQRLI